MVARHWSSRLARLSAVAIALAAAGWLAGPVAATELDKLDTSLKLIPEDAAFYSSMLRNREQFEAIRNSNAWAKVREMPVVQMGVSLYQMQLGTPGAGRPNSRRLEEPRGPQDRRSRGRHGFRRRLRLRRR